MGGNQATEAVLANGNQALVYDGCIGVGRGDSEMIAACKKVLVEDIRGRGQQAMNIDLRTRANQNPVGVYQPNMPIRL